MKKLLVSGVSLLFFVAAALFGYTDGTIHVADVSIRPDLKHVTYYKAIKVEMSGVTYRWVLLAPQEISDILKMLQGPKLDQTRRIDDALIKTIDVSHSEINKILARVLNDFNGRKIKRVIKVLKKEKPGLVDKLAVVLPDLGGY